MTKTERKQHIINASDVAVGRIASQAAVILMGKNKPTYAANVDCGDVVIVENASKLKFTGIKLDDKVYRRHSMYPGGLKSMMMRDVFKKSPEYLIKKVIYNMLPKNKLRKTMMKRLLVKS